MDDVGRFCGRKAGLIALISGTFGLSGCIAAAVPLMLAAAAVPVAVGGFGIYKTVQIAGGGSVAVAFPAVDGKETPPAPLLPARKVAVWPGNEGEVRFAEKLASSGRFDVTPPGRVSAVLAAAGMGIDLKLLTEQEQAEAFSTVCRQTTVDLVFASRDQGQTTDSNMFSFSRANVTYKADLLAYSCTRQAIIWRDQIALIVEGGGSTASTGEMYDVGADAWAERIMRAQGAGAVQAGAS